MGRKTIILTENQFNEICGTNTAYLDNPGDYTKDGTLHMRTDGAVSDSYGGRENYSEPPTTDDIADTMAPETLFAILFRNGGHGLWGHWGSGLRASTVDGFNSNFDNTYVIDKDEDDEGWLNESEDTFDSDIDPEELIYYSALKCLRGTDFRNTENLDDYIYDAMEILSGEKPDEMVRPKEIECYLNNDIKSATEQVVRLVMKKIDYEYYWEQYAGSTIRGLNESNSELEGRSWNGISYTNLTTKKTQFTQQLAALRKANAPAQQIKRVQAALNAVTGILNRETGAIRDRKEARKRLGMTNQFQKAGGTKNSGNGKAHTRKKVTDPNVGTGFITYK